MKKFLRLHDEWVRWFARIPPSLLWTILLLLGAHLAYRLLSGERVFDFVPSFAEAPVQWAVMLVVLILSIPWFIRLMKIAREPSQKLEQ
jgi:hypothetical protein